MIEVGTALRSNKEIILSLTIVRVRVREGYLAYAGF